MTLRDTVTLSDGSDDRLRGEYAQAGAAFADHHSDHHCALFGPVRQRSPSFRIPLDLHSWTSANGCERTADGWEFPAVKGSPAQPG
jgi:hypothetical protein